MGPGGRSAKYEIEINSDEGFASGGKVCCSSTTISTSFTPSTLLPADTYYWRVRAIDSSGHAGDWNVYGGATPDTFTIAFDTGSGAITNLHMRDNLSDPGAWSPGYTTQVPIVTWDPVPGAAQYQVNVTPFTGGICDWGASASSQWKSETASTSWTPLGSGYSGAKPYNTSANVASDSPSLAVNGYYCVRVRAERNTDTGNHTVFGNYSCLATATTRRRSSSPAIPPVARARLRATRTTRARVTTCRRSRHVDGAKPAVHVEPAVGRPQLLRGVATDRTFQNVVDYAFTQVPAYAPRQSFQVTTYPDSNTSYYWAVLPALRPTAPVLSVTRLGPGRRSQLPQDFQKHSNAPTLDAPSDGQVVTTQPTFQWSPVEGALRYRLEVSQDPSFGTLVGNMRCHDRRDCLHQRHHVPGRHHALLAGARGGREADRSGLVGHAHLPEDQCGADVPDRSKLDVRVADPGVAVGCDARCRRIRRPRRSAGRIVPGLQQHGHTAFTATSMTGTGIFTWKVRGALPDQLVRHDHEPVVGPPDLRSHHPGAEQSGHTATARTRCCCPGTRCRGRSSTRWSCRQPTRSRATSRR
jgi:hypothetical protein